MKTSIVLQASLQQSGFIASAQQAAIFGEFAKLTGNLVVRARAGTGKTTTIIKGLTYFVGGLKILLAAFNKKIAVELAQRVDAEKPAAQVEVKTLHALGFAFIRQNWRGVKIDEKRGDKLAAKTLPFGTAKHIIFAVSKLASSAKGVAPFASVADLEDLVWENGLLTEEMEKDGITAYRLATCAHKALDLASKNDGTIDFDDMPWVPVRNGYCRPWYNVVIIDECQDMNPVQITLAMKACKRGGRIIVVGDDRQAIYGFRGADSGSLDRLKRELKATELPLSITYRCPQLIVDRAAKLVPDFQAAPGAPQGIIDSLHQDQIADVAVPGNAIISRKNAPLMPLCLKLLSRGVKAYIEGREIGAQLIKIVERIAGKSNSVGSFLTNLDAWRDKEIARVKKSKHANIEKIVDETNDKAECLAYLIADLDSVDALVDRIKHLFADTGDKAKTSVILSSIHRSKGLEFERVFGLEYTLRNGGGEEDNLAYVLWTRSKHHYTIVTNPGKE